MTQCKTQKEWFSVEQCNDNPRNLYVFGDNLKRIGKGGQAQIRDCKNSYGIATKRNPSMDENAFFSDRYDEYTHLSFDLKQLIAICKVNKYDIIIFPYDGLGTGLARMNETSPKLFENMNYIIKMAFDVEFKDSLLLRIK